MHRNMIGNKASRRILAVVLVIALLFVIQHLSYNWTRALGISKLVESKISAPIKNNAIVSEILIDTKYMNVVAVTTETTTDILIEEEVRINEGKLETNTILPTEAYTLDNMLKQVLQCKDRVLQKDKLQYGSYWLLQNFVIGSISKTLGCASSITYTTHGDYTFFTNLPEVVKRWLAPVSFAIFAPGYDINATVDSVLYARNCIPESDLIREYVTIHIYFPATNMPAFIPIMEDDALNWPYDCEQREAPYLNVNRSEMYKTKNNLTYPINVGRNIARKAANTYFIFACDIELYPSPGLVPKFLEMIANEPFLISTEENLRVFVLPVFELEKKASLPENKTQLVDFLKRKLAVPFHLKMCARCHLVPEQKAWINATDDNELKLFSMTKRQKEFRSWEPFYISDNREPMFDERVTWEGQSNKRIQGYAMCLLGYEYHVLHPAFLTHAPGIKHSNDKSRMKFVYPMNKFIQSTIKPEYQILYGKNHKCTV